MHYTVKKVAKLSGTSVRTLHYYDEIGLLKPAYVSQTGYRYYQEKELLILQQILFFKELGLELKQIQKLLESKDFDKVKALRSHKEVLQQRIYDMNTLLETIDKTIDHIERKTIMKEQELFWGFNKEKQHEYEKYLLETKGNCTEKLIHESYKNIKNWTKKDWDIIKSEYDIIYKELVICLEKNLNVESTEVQILIARYFQIIKKFYLPTKEVFSGLGQLYIDHPDFKKLYDAYHPQLAHYLAAAMKVYAQKELK